MFHNTCIFRRWLLCFLVAIHHALFGAGTSQLLLGYSFSRVLGAVGSRVATGAGDRGPYLAGYFPVPPCAQPPPPSVVVGTGGSSVALALLGMVIFRLGGDPACATGIADDPAALVCNGPLWNGTAYRVKFVLLARSSLLSPPAMETPWSDPISTKPVVSVEQIHVWPGKRTGGMVVVTSVLCSILFVLLFALTAALLAPSRDGKEITKEARTSQISGLESQFRNKAFDEGQAAAETLKH
uniref:Uroplakin-3a-like isoform X2 n=1 Tax=Petromyzon marinus TaxID=7757 RepID=A0AAJ7UD56_PETMA|nr:uroplakin-3a-like isoform X2 [Petromyzon marinus]